MAKIKNKVADVTDAVKSNESFQKASSAIGGAASQIFSEYTPVTYNTLTSGAELIKSFRDTFRRSKQAVKQEQARTQNTSLGKASITFFTEAFRDIRGGSEEFTEINENLYDDVESDGDLDFSDDFDWGGDDEGDEENAEPLSDSENTQKAILLGDKAIASTMLKSTTAELRGMETATRRIVSSNLKASKASTLAMQNQLSQGFNLLANMLTGTNHKLDTINENISQIIKFNNENTTKFYTNALNLINGIGKMIANINEQNELNLNNDNGFSALQGFNFNDYFKRVLKNAKGTEFGMVASSLKSIIGSGEGSIFGKIMGMAVSMGLSMIVPKVLTDPIKRIDKSLGVALDELPDMLDKLMYEKFGFKASGIFGDFRKGKYLNAINVGNYEKGALAWNGKAQKALVDVIPEYLGSIEHDLEFISKKLGLNRRENQDKNIRRFNYETGKFITHKEQIYNITKDFETAIQWTIDEGHVQIEEIARIYGLGGGHIEYLRNYYSLCVQKACRGMSDEATNQAFAPIVEVLHRLHVPSRTIASLRTTFYSEVKAAKKEINNLVDNMSKNNNAMALSKANSIKINNKGEFVGYENSNWTTERFLEEKMDFMSLSGSNANPQTIYNKYMKLRKLKRIEIDKARMIATIEDELRSGETNINAIYEELDKIAEENLNENAMKKQMKENERARRRADIERRRENGENKSWQDKIFNIKETTRDYFDRLREFGYSKAEKINRFATEKGEQISKHGMERLGDVDQFLHGDMSDDYAKELAAKLYDITKFYERGTNEKTRQEARELGVNGTLRNRVKILEHKDILEHELMKNVGDKKQLFKHVENITKKIAKDIEGATKSDGSLESEIIRSNNYLQGMMATFLVQMNFQNKAMFGPGGIFDENEEDSEIKKTVETLFTNENAPFRGLYDQLKAFDKEFKDNGKNDLRSAGQFWFDSVADYLHGKRDSEGNLIRGSYRENKDFYNSILGNTAQLAGFKIEGFNNTSNIASRLSHDSLVNLEYELGAIREQEKKIEERENYKKTRRDLLNKAEELKLKGGKTDRIHGFKWINPMFKRRHDLIMEQLKNIEYERNKKPDNDNQNLGSGLGYGPVSPVSVANVGKQIGGFSQGGANERLLTAGAARFGLQSTKLNNFRDIVHSLGSGSPTILAGKGGAPYTRAGHILAAEGLSLGSGGLSTTITNPLTGRSSSIPLSKLRGTHTAFSYSGFGRALGFGKALGYGEDDKLPNVMGPEELCAYLLQHKSSKLYNTLKQAASRRNIANIDQWIAALPQLDPNSTIPRPLYFNKEIYIVDSTKEEMDKMVEYAKSNYGKLIGTTEIKNIVRDNFKDRIIFRQNAFEDNSALSKRGIHVTGIDISGHSPGKILYDTSKNKSVFIQETNQKDNEAYTKLRALLADNPEMSFEQALEQVGLIDRLREFDSNLENLETFLFGDPQEEPKKKKEDYIEAFKKYIPKSLMGGAGGLALGLLNNSYSLLGSLFLPGGPVGGAILGTGLTFLSQTEAFKEFVFGKKNQYGEREGGMISAELREKFKKALPLIVGSGTVGAISKILMGAVGFSPSLGILGLSITPPGILGGAMIGAGLAFLRNSETFNEVVFGKKDENGRYTGAILGSLRNQWNESSKKFFPTVKSAIKGAGIGVISGATLGQMGILGGALATGLGGPVGMGLMGLGLGIASTTDKFNDWMFGTEYEKDNKKFRDKNGFLQRSTNMLRSEVIEPLAMAFKHNLRNFGDWVQTAISIPFRRTVGPIIDTIKTSILKIKSDISDWIKDMISDFSNFIKRGFDRTVKAVFTPIGRAISKVGRGILGAAKLGAKIAASPLTIGLKATEIMTAPLRGKKQAEFYKTYYSDLLNGNVGKALKQRWAERKANGEHVGILDKLGDRFDALFMKGDVGDSAYEGFVQHEEDQGRNVANWLRLGRKSKEVREAAKIRKKEYKQYLAFNKEASKIRRDINNVETTQLTADAFKKYKEKLASTGFNKRYMDKIKTSEDMMNAIFHTTSFMDKIDNPEKYKNTGEEMLEAENQQTEELKNVSANTASILDVITQSYRLRFNAKEFNSRPQAIQNEILKQKQRAGKAISGMLKNGVYTAINKEGQTETYKKKEIMKILDDNRLIQYNLGGIDKKLIDSYLATRTKNDEKGLAEGFYEYIEANSSLKDNNSYFKELESWIPDIVNSARYGIGDSIFGKGAIFGKNGAPGQFKLIVKAIYDDVYNNINQYESVEDVKNKLFERFSKAGVKVSDAIVEALAKAIYKQTKATAKYAAKDIASSAIDTAKGGIETGKKVISSAANKGKGFFSRLLGKFGGYGLGYGNISIPGINLDAPLGFGKKRKENTGNNEIDSSFERKLIWEAKSYRKYLTRIEALYNGGKIDATRVREMVDSAISFYHQGIERQDDWKKILKRKNAGNFLTNMNQEDWMDFYNKYVVGNDNWVKELEAIKSKHVDENGNYVGDEEFLKRLSTNFDEEKDQTKVMQNLLAGIYVATSGGGDPKKISKLTDFSGIQSLWNKFQNKKLYTDIEAEQTRYIRRATGKLRRSDSDLVDLAAQFRNFKGRNTERLGKVKQGASELFDIFKETKVGKMLGGSLSFLIRGFILSTLGLSAMDFFTDSRFGKNLTKLSDDFAKKINSNGLYQSYIDPVINSVTGSIKAWADRAADEEGSVGNYIGKKVTEKMETGINYLVTGSEKAGEFIPKYIENYFIPSAERISKVVADNAGNIVKIAGNVLIPLTKAMIFEITPMAIKTAATIGKTVLYDGIDRIFGGLDNPFNTEVTGRFVKGAYLARNAAKNGSKFANRLLRLPGNIIGGAEGAVSSVATKMLTKNPLALGVRKLGEFGGFWTKEELKAFDRAVGTRNLMSKGATIGGDITSGNIINSTKSLLGKLKGNGKVITEEAASKEINRIIDKRIAQTISDRGFIGSADDILKNIIKNEKSDIVKEASKNLGGRITTFKVVDDEVKAGLGYITRLKNGIIKTLEKFRNSKVFNSLIEKLGIKGEKIIPELIELFTKTFSEIASKIPGNKMAKKLLSPAIRACGKAGKALASGAPIVGQVLIAYSGIAGAGAGSTANLFRVSAEDVTPTMRLVSGIINLFESTLIGIGFIFLDTIGRLFGIDMRGLVAKAIYHLIPWTDEEDYEALANKQSELEKELEHYNEVTGKDLSIEEYNDMMNKGWISTIIDKLKPGESERDKAIRIAQEGGYAKSDTENIINFTKSRMSTVEQAEELENYGTGDINNNEFKLKDSNRTTTAFSAVGLNGALEDIPLVDIKTPEDATKYQILLMKRQLQELMIIRRSLVQSSNNNVKIQSIQAKNLGDTFDKITNAIMVVNPVVGATVKAAGYLYNNRKSTTTKTPITVTRSASDVTNSIMDKYGDLGEGIGYGNMYDQNNPEYANIPIGYFHNGKVSTIKSGGCGAVALSKVINDVYGYGPVNPIAVANVSKSMGGISEGGTNEIGLTSVANQFGVASTRLRNGRDLVNSLRTGHPVIMAGQDSRGSSRTPFTPGKHIVSMKGIMRDRNNNFYTTVLDSNTGKYGHYKLKDLASKASHAFAYGRRKSVGHGNVSRRALGYGFGDFKVEAAKPKYINNKNELIKYLIQVALAEDGYKQKSGPNVPMDSKTEYVGTNSQKYTKYARDLDAIDFYDAPKQGLDWCDVFVDWCFVKTFGPDEAVAMTGGRSALCSQSYADFVNIGSAPSTPEPGDQIFFNQHTGLVYEVKDNTVYTIEGNCTLGSSRGVVKRHYNINSREIQGYGRPKWEYANGVNLTDFGSNTSESGEAILPPVYSFEEFAKLLRGKGFFGKIQLYAKLGQAQFNALMGSDDLWYEFNVLSGAIEASSNSNTTGTESYQPNSTDVDKIVHNDLMNFSPTTAEQLNKWLNTTITNAGNKDKSLMYNKGATFMRASEVSGLDPRYIIAHAAHESGWGTSPQARNKHNFFGIGSFTNNPEKAFTFGNDVDSGIIEGANWIRRNYYDVGQKTIYNMRYNNGRHEYTDDSIWVNSIGSIYKNGPKNENLGTGLLGYGPEDDADREVKARRFQRLKNAFSSIGQYMSGWLASKGLDLGNTFSDNTGSSDYSYSDNNVNNYNANPSYISGNIAFPLSSGPEHSSVSAGYPRYPSGNEHKGVDFVPTDGSTPYVISARDGTVVYVKNSGTKGYGNHILIKGDDGYGYLYGHMKSLPNFKPGDRVTAGTVLGVMGYTGHVIPSGPGGAHTHVEVRRNPNANGYGTDVDPFPFLGLVNKTGAIQRLGSGNLTNAELKTLGLSSNDSLYKLDSINNMGDYHFDNNGIFDTTSVNGNTGNINNINIEDEETVNKLEKIISIMLEWHKDSVKGTNAQLALANKNIKVFNNTNNTFNNNQARSNTDVNPTKYKDTIVNQHAILAYRSNLKKDI